MARATARSAASPGRRTGFGVYGVSGDTTTLLGVPSGFPALNAGVYGYGINGAAGAQWLATTGNGVVGTSASG